MIKIGCLLRSLRRQINIFGGGIARVKNEFFGTKCRKIVKPFQRLMVSIH